MLRLDFTGFTVRDFETFLGHIRVNDYRATAETLAGVVVEWDEETDPNLPESYPGLPMEYYASVLVAVQKQITDFIGDDTVEDDGEVVVDLSGWKMDHFHIFVNAAQEGDYATIGEMVQLVVVPWPYEGVEPLDLDMPQFRRVMKAVNAKTAATFRSG